MDRVEVEGADDDAPIRIVSILEPLVSVERLVRHGANRVDLGYQRHALAVPSTWPPTDIGPVSELDRRVTPRDVLSEVVPDVDCGATIRRCFDVLFDDRLDVDRSRVRNVLVDVERVEAERIRIPGSNGARMPLVVEEVLLSAESDRLERRRSPVHLALKVIGLPAFETHGRQREAALVVIGPKETHIKTSAVAC